MFYLRSGEKFSTFQILWKQSDGDDEARKTIECVMALNAFLSVTQREGKIRKLHGHLVRDMKNRFDVVPFFSRNATDSQEMFIF